eukprot:g7960.t1
MRRQIDVRIPSLRAQIGVRIPSLRARFDPACSVRARFEPLRARLDPACSVRAISTTGNRRKTGFVWHELYMWHNTGNFAGELPYGFPLEPYEHFENPSTKRRIWNLIQASGLAEQLHMIKPRPATDQELLRFHTQAHLDRLAQFNQSLLVDAGGGTPMGKGSYEIARLSAGGVIEAVQHVLNGQVQNAYALVRPPGHHCLADQAMGFCLLGNAAVAGFDALDKAGLERIAFVDIDVHHGNGTQEAFYSDPRALTISLHQDQCYPQDSGFLSERGEGKGFGTNINIPLPPGSGVGAYSSAFARVVIPAIEKFRPGLIIVPCGFDGGAFDPLGRMMLTSEGYRDLTKQLMDVADRVCDGKLVFCHEGGYSAPTVPFFGLAVVETLSQIKMGVPDPYQPILGGLGQQALQPHQAALIDQAVRLLDDVPSPCS